MSATPEQLEQLQAVVPFAQAAQRRWHVPASVSLAQWIFESTWGTSRLTLEANNCFGIKHRQQDASEPYVEFPTMEYSSSNAVAKLQMAPFVKYPSIAACFDAHGRLIGSSSRYMRAVAAPDVPSFCRAIQSCGYSTNPKYAAMLIAEIAARNLTQYDNLPPADPAAKAVA